MKEYDVIQGYWKEFVEMCNAKLAQGWIPQGGVFVFVDSKKPDFYYQAFVR